MGRMEEEEAIILGSILLMNQGSEVEAVAFILAAEDMEAMAAGLGVVETTTTMPMVTTSAILEKAMAVVVLLVLAMVEGEGPVGGTTADLVVNIRRQITWPKVEALLLITTWEDKPSDLLSRDGVSLRSDKEPHQATKVWNLTHPSRTPREVRRYRLHSLCRSRVQQGRKGNHHWGLNLRCTRRGRRHKLVQP